MTQNKPDYAIAEKCISLRKKSKQGQYTSDDENEFIYSCWKRWPEWYKESEERVFIETRPFGSEAKYKP